MKNIAIVSPNTDTFTNPTMTSLFHLLNEKGIRVYLFGPEQQPACPDNITNVTIIFSQFKLYLFRNPRNYIAQWKLYCNVLRVIRSKKIRTLLAVDPLGLIIGGRIKKVLGKDLHLSYLSFEIFFKDELKGYYLDLKNKEIYYSKNIDSLLTQDEKRKELLFEENKLHLKNEQVALVPVSPMKIEVKEKPDLHTKLGIPKDKKLAVYSGSVGEWCGTKAIIEAFDKGYWCNDYHLVFHTRKSIDASNEFYADLSRLDTDVNMSFSLHPNPFDSFEDLSVFLSGFDLALALYYPNNQNPYYGKNMREIGLSSGKFSTYMMLGLPTIVTPCDIYDRLNKEYLFGYIVNENESLEKALSNCHKNINFRELYDTELNSKLYLLKYMDVLKIDNNE